MGDTFFGLTGFILTKWYVKLLILTTFSAVACFILTKWYVKILYTEKHDTIYRFYIN
ncbi:Uncharacterised protein [Clostridioides difficile]|nr:Uncharacterised protein [Clostridioides difficile]